MEVKEKIILARTGFWTSTVSFIVFFALDFLRPGFTSRAFSVHLFLLAAILFGAWWAHVDTAKHRGLIPLVIAGLLGIVVAVIGWNLGEGFGEFRPIVALLLLFIPFYLVRLLRV